jgi:hypothetical protein
LLVPRRDPASGKIHYQTELHIIRVPVRREDRLAFLDRLNSAAPCHDHQT